MHLIRITLFSFLLILSLPIQASEEDTRQETKNPAFAWGLYFHELVTLGQYSRITLAPITGVHVGKRILVGTHYKYRYSNTPGYQAHDFSISPFIAYTLSESIHHYAPFGLFLQTEYELLNYDQHGSYSRRQNVHLCWAGLGLRQSFGNNNSFNISLMLELTQHERAPQSPSFRLHILF